MSSAVDGGTIGPAGTIRRATILVPTEPGTLQNCASTRTSWPSPMYGCPLWVRPSIRVWPSTYTCAEPRSRWCRCTVEESTCTLMKPNAVRAGPVMRTGPPSVHPRVSSVGMVAPVSTFVTPGK